MSSDHSSDGAISRGESKKKSNVLGVRSAPPHLSRTHLTLPQTTVFFVGRLADPFLQYRILSNDFGTGLVTSLGGNVLARGPPLITNTPLDHVVGLSPYRSILLAMSTTCMLKQNFTLLATQQEEMSPAFSAQVGVFNAVCNSINSLLFITSQTSASVNGEHFPQTPLIVGSVLFATGLFVEAFSEIQRAAWKKDPQNKGKVYDGGLFGLSRHVNYFGYTMWRTGYSMAAGGFTWAGITAGAFTWQFLQVSIPELQSYLEKRVSPQPSSQYFDKMTDLAIVRRAVRGLQAEGALCVYTLCHLSESGCEPMRIAVMFRSPCTYELHSDPSHQLMIAQKQQAVQGGPCPSAQGVQARGSFPPQQSLSRRQSPRPTAIPLRSPTDPAQAPPSFEPPSRSSNPSTEAHRKTRQTGAGMAAVR